MACETLHRRKKESKKTKQKKTSESEREDAVLTNTERK